MSELQQIIESAFEDRAEITPDNVEPGVRDAVLAAIDLLDSGEQRVAEQGGRPKPERHWQRGCC